jgi:DNA modification methylase
MRTARILVGDVRERLRDLPDRSVQCCVTSPPYWGLRDYGVVGQLGMQQTPEAYVSEMADVFDEVRRVLRDDGTAWVNLGDSYQNAKGQAHGVDPKQPARRHGLRPQDVSIPGLKPKDLVGIPWMFAFEARRRGWWLRSDIIWSKPNPMPESVTDRPTKAHEYIFLLSKSERYFYDADAIAEETVDPESRKGFTRSTATDSIEESGDAGYDGHRTRMGIKALKQSGKIFTTRNKRTVWTVTTQPYPEAHFATYPEALIEPCILAGSRVDDTVLDPFCGSGTTGVVACRHNRHFIGVELNPQYAALAEKRITGDAGLLNRVEVA